MLRYREITNNNYAISTVTANTVPFLGALFMCFKPSGDRFDAHCCKFFDGNVVQYPKAVRTT